MLFLVSISFCSILLADSLDHGAHSDDSDFHNDEDEDSDFDGGGKKKKGKKKACVKGRSKSDKAKSSISRNKTNAVSGK